MPKTLPQDAQLLLLVLWIVGGLLLIALIRIILLSRSNRRLLQSCEKMEKQSSRQHQEIAALHEDSESWRAQMQRQFDTLRSELSQRLQQTELCNQQSQDRLDAAQKQALTAVPAPAAPVAVPLSWPEVAPTPPAPAILALPAMETLRLEASEAELAAAKADLAVSRQQNAVLQRALLMARRKQPAGRKNGSRSALRGA